MAKSAAERLYEEAIKIQQQRRQGLTTRGSANTVITGQQEKQPTTREQNVQKIWDYVTAERKKRQNVEANLRQVGRDYGERVASGRQTVAADKLQRTLMTDAVGQLDKQIENELNIINKQGRAEDDPAVSVANERLADLMNRRTNAQSQLAQVQPRYVAKDQTGEHLDYPREVNDYIRKMQEISQSAGKRLTERGVTRLPGGVKIEGQIPKVLSREYAEYQHMINTPESENSEDYVNWLKEGRDVGLYGDRELNAMMANVGSKNVADEYAKKDSSEKSSWLNLKHQDEMYWDEAMKRTAENPEGGDEAALRALRQYYHDELASRYYNDEEFWQGEREAAQSRLARLNGSWLQYTPNGERMPTSIMGRKGNYDTPEQMARMDQMLYDAVMGEGAYQAEIDSYEGTTFRDAHMRELNNRIERAWEYYENANPYMNGSRDALFDILTGRDAEHDADRVAALESERRYLNGKIAETDERLNYYDRVRNLKAGYQEYAGENSTEDDASFDKGKYNPNDYRFTMAEKGSNNVDDIYSFIMGGNERMSYVDAYKRGSLKPDISKDYKGAMLLQPDEINIFKNLYEAGKKDEAIAFLDGLKFAIDNRYAPYEELRTREEARAFPIFSSIFAQGANVVNTALGGMNAIDAALRGAGVEFSDNDAAANPYSDAYAPVRYAQQTQDEIASMLGPEGGKLYLQSMNSIRNVINGVLMYKLGIPEGMLPTATLATFGTQIYQEQMYNYLKDNYDFDKASALATLDTALEIGEELLPIETMFATAGASLFVRIISNMLSEAGEEFTGATVGKVLKGIITGQNEWSKREDQIYNEGGYLDDDGNWVSVGRGREGLAQAEKQAMREWGKEIIENTAAGAFGGGFGAAYGAITTGRQMSQAGQTIRSRQNIVGTETGADQLIKAAQGMAEGTESRKIADKIAEKVANGGKASNYQLGKLVYTMAQESNENIADIAQGTLERTAREQLAGEGVDQKTIDKVAPIVAKVAARGTKALTISERLNLASSRNAIDLLRSFIADDGTLKEVQAAMNEDNSGKVSMNVQQTVRDLMGGHAAVLKSGFATKDIAEAERRAVVAEEDDIRNAAGKMQNNGLDVIVDNVVGQIVGRKGNEYTVRFEDGSEKSVTGDKVLAATKSLATLIEYGESGSSNINDDAFNTILAGVEQNNDMDGAQYVSEAVNAYIRFRTLGNVENSSINPETMKSIRTAAEEANRKARDAANAKGKSQEAVTPGKGTLSYDGIQYGAQGWRQKVKELGAAKAEQASALGQLVTMMGNRVRLINDENNPGLFGWEDETGEIVINLAAKDMAGTEYAHDRSLMTIAAHELTHWIEQNSREGYEQLRQFVFDQLRAQGGENAVETLVLQTMEDYRRAAENNRDVQAVDLEGAMAEVVANACDNILSNRKVAEALQAENPDLYKTVRGFVRDFVARMRSATRDMSSTRESRIIAKASKEVQDQMADIWLKGWKEGTQLERQAKPAEKEDIRFSVQQAQEEAKQIKDVDGNPVISVTDSGTVTQYSYKSYIEEDQRGKIIKVLQKMGYSDEEIRKWTKDLDEVASIIEADPTRLDFKPDRTQKFKKPNGDVYKWTLDASSLCAKRLLYQGTFNEIQKQLPNTPLRPGDLIDLVNMMHDMGYVTPCGICYVESRRRHTGNAIEQFLNDYKGEYKPNYADLASTEGLAKLREEHKEAYDAFIKAMNKRGAGSIKLVQLRTDYRNDVRRMGRKVIDYLNSIGGLRIQSFSDFETPHMLDLMQAVVDMKMKGLKSQAYTKVPNFAWVFGDTGIKINLSLMGDGKGVDKNGRLIFSNTEGMRIDQAMMLRSRYSKNVGTILVGMNDEHIRAAMADDRIDFIIPFHKSGWSKEEFDKMKTLKGYQDYEEWQNERNIKGYDSNGNPIYKNVKDNIEPSEYWQYDGRSGKENAQAYLNLCKERGIVPKFNNFLVDNGDGSYSMPEDGSADGYWKLLIDFKMYDNDGNPAEQQVVDTNFNMEEARRVLADYKGGADSLPVAEPVVKKYVEQYKEKHPLTGSKKQYSVQQMGLAEMEQAYEEAYNNYDDEEGERIVAEMAERAFPDSKVRDENGKLKVVYHQTNAVDEEGNPFTVFDMTKARQASDIVGAFFAPKFDEYHEYGDRTYAVYLNITNPKYDVFDVDSSKMDGGLRKRNELIEQGYDGVINTEDGEIIEYVAFYPEQIKSAEPFTEDNDGNLIPLIQRMNKWEPDLRYSIDQNDMDVRVWMQGLTDGSVSTAQEKAMLKQYQTLAKDLEVERGLLFKRRQALREMQKNPNPSVYDRKKMRDAQATIEAKQKQLDTKERKLMDMTSETGFAKLMYDQAKIMNDLVNGRTVEEVQQTVNDMSGELDMITRQMAEREKEIADLKQKAMAAVSALENVPGAEAAANQLKVIVSQMTLNEKNLQRAKTRIGEVAENAKVAGVRTGNIQKAVNAAIAYNNKLTEQSEAATWQEERRKLVNTLRSEHTQAMLRQQSEFKLKLQKDKQIQQAIRENQNMARKIDLNVNRVRAMMAHENTKVFAPERIKPVAREMLRKIVNNEGTGRWKLTGFDSKQLAEIDRLLKAWDDQDGKYSPDSLKGLDEGLADALVNALEQLQAGIDFLNASERNNDRLVNIQAQKNALTRVYEAVTTITSAIYAERKVTLDNRKEDLEQMAYRVQEGTNGRQKKERTGKLGMALNEIHKAVISGNLTPEYFFKMLKNGGLNRLWEEYHRQENRNGLLLQQAKEHLEGIADKYGYKNWDTDKTVTVSLNSGDVQMTLGQLMALYATWKRENTLGPQMSEHLKMGGFYVEQGDPRKGILGSRTLNLRAHRVNDEDMEGVKNLLTQEQKDFVDDVVSYMSNEMSEIGNEASMKAYGIKMYKEKYYYPFKIWDGVKSKASNDAGKAAGKVDAVFHPSFSKGRLHGANNAVILGDFLQTAADHIVGMINYATIGVANENMQKVLNAQVPEGDRLDTMTKRSIRAVLQEAYGREAMDYMEKVQEQMNGGVQRVERSLYDRALTLFRKNAVAGSMSVTLQQPLSYIRAAMLINPKYLVGSISPQYWKGSFKEMMAHSGVAVIKKMGRFDMGFGAGAREYITPEGKEGKIRKAWDTVTDKSTILPELFDQMTWTRMWTAVKMEQHALHPNMDVKSDEFLDMCGTRFNEVMRRTQVYDSVLTKSQNMRSQNPFVKSITSFMAEPTLTLNVLADAMQNIGQKGGKMMAVKALATFALSAAAQAAVKALMSSGRTPDEKKTFKENWLYRFYANLLNEVDVLNLVPGYNDLITLLKSGKLEDDALGMAGKISKAFETTAKMFNSGAGYREIEDGVGQIVQLFTQLPAKNIMRDLRAMYNWFIGKPYADRETSAAVLKYQAIESRMTADNLLGVIVARMDEAGYKTTNAGYYSRMFDAMQAGNQEEADAIREYLYKGKGVKGDAINAGLKKQAKERLEEGEATQWLIDHDMMTDTSTITKQYKEGKITAEQAASMYKEVDSRLTDNDVWFKIDQADWLNETGEATAGSEYYYRLGPALDSNRSAEINKVISGLMKHGKTQKEIKSRLTTEMKDKYLNGSSSEKVKTRNALQIAYKAIGLTAADADKTIEGWNKDAKKQAESKEPKKPENKDTTGQWGKGNINLNKRQVVHNPDGSISTELSITIGVDDKVILIPTVVNGKIVSDEEAIRHYEQTGEYLGKFNTEKEADEYAEKLHKRQEWYYKGK